MDCCLFILIILGLVVLMIFAGAIIGVLFMVYTVLAALVNRIVRIFWAKGIAELPYNDLQKMLKDLTVSLTKLRERDSILTASVKNGESKGLSFEYYTNRVQLDDAIGREEVLRDLIQQKRPLENARSAEEQLERNKEIDKLTLTSEYELIERFVSKTPVNEFNEALPKLRLLLEGKGWNLRIDELQDLIKKEGRKQDTEKAKAKILENDPQTRQDILKAYLEYYQPDSIQLVALNEILQEKDLGFTPHTPALRKELRKLKQEIEAENFEKHLMDENEVK